MKYVLDSSVAVKWALKEAGTPKALALRDDVEQQIHEVIAPDVFVSEVAHALTRYAGRDFRLTDVEGDIVQDLFT